MTLGPTDFLNGISSLIYVAVTILVGLTILSKYFKLDKRAFLFVGLTWIGMSEPWIPSGVSFIWNLIFQEGLPFVAYVIIGNVFAPVTIFLWMFAVTDLLYKKKQKLILAIYASIGVAFEIVFFSLLFINQDWIGVWGEGSEIIHIDIQYRAFMMVFLLWIVATFLITGIIFARNSLQSNVPEVNLKGKFLMIAFLTWCIGAILDSSIPLNLLTLPITRILLVSSALFFYIGYILPPGIKDLILTE